MGRNKMNNKKTLTSLAAASMVITQAGQMSVFAKDATADPETPAEKEETKVEKTQKELLEEKIKFLDIADLIEECMDKFKEKSNMELTIDNIITVDKEVREYLRKKVS